MAKHASRKKKIDTRFSERGGELGGRASCRRITNSVLNGEREKTKRVRGER